MINNQRKREILTKTGFIDFIDNLIEFTGVLPSGCGAYLSVIGCNRL